MPDPMIQKRNVADRVDPPPPLPAGRSSLIPDDIWSSYQEELSGELNPSQLHAIQIGSGPVEARSGAGEGLGAFAEHLSGSPSSVGPVDPEVAIFALTRMHLFSELDRPSLEALVKDARQAEIDAGAYLFREGESADSFYVVLEGAVEILRHRDEREVTLRRMGRGEAIGLVGLFSGQVRAACARAIGDAVVLEVPCHSLNERVQADSQLHGRLLKFYRERLVEAFLVSSLLFTDLEQASRVRLIGRFTERHLAKGETLLQPGEVCNLLALVINGGLALDQPGRAGQQPKSYELYPGQYVAVTSAFAGAPSKMRIHATEATTLAMLGHRDLAELMREYPALRSLTARLNTAARPLDRDVFCGHTGAPGL